MAKISIFCLPVALIIANFWVSGKASVEDDHLAPKYAVNPKSKLEALFHLDLEIYKNVVRLFPPKLCANPSPAESLVLSYLQDFQETFGDNILKSGAHDAEIVSNLIRNQLAIYRTLWRFENYIQKIAKLSVANGGTALRGRSVVILRLSAFPTGFHAASPFFHVQ